MRGRVVFEAVGNPKEFIVEFLNKLLEDLKKFEGVEIISHRIEEPLEREIEREDGSKVKMWSSFLESEIEFENIEKLFEFVLMYSPSSIEIFDIDEVTLNKDKLNAILNDICMRVIQLNLAIQDLYAQNQMLMDKLSKIAPRFVKKES